MIKVATNNLFANAISTASSTASGFSAGNVTDLPIKKRWRSTSPSGQWLKFDLGSATAINAFLLSFHNLTVSGTYRLFGHTSDLGSNAATWLASATFNTNNTMNRDQDVLSLFMESSQNLRWWFLEINDPSNSEGYVEAGFVFAGLTNSPDENFNENLQVSWIDTSTVQHSDGQARFTVQKERFKVFDITFTDVDSANQDVIEAWWTATYKTVPFLAALDTDNHAADWSRIVHFDTDLSWGFGANERATAAFSLKELR